MKVKPRKRVPVSIKIQDIEEVDQFTCLGSIMNRTGGTNADIRTRISKARPIFAMLKFFSQIDNIYRKYQNSNFQHQCKMSLFLWRTNLEITARVQVFIKKCLHQIVNFVKRGQKQLIRNVYGNEPTSNKQLDR